ncbi:MAG: polysaccharide deacetylase family protein [Sphingomonadaceae bacterium]|nr:polysaccharide deacetylase family protein [Sphingomonadaceae bacterium]
MSALGGPRFILTVDTEEEFDWNKPFARDGFGTSHLHAVPRFQELCGKYGIIPCYLIDFPIAEDSFGVELLGGYARNGVAEIGVQLHPWVNPPFDEPVSLQNSYACNLPEALERAKLTILHETIVSRFELRPDAYRAGRYGAGANTAAILDDLGITIDSSVRSRFNYSDQGGPDYTYHPLAPYWLRSGSVLELPLTTVFAGALRSAGPVMFGEIFESQTVRSMLARSKMLERIALTPEGIPLSKALEGIDLALEKAVPIINLSFHSPSLAIGHTPYVQDAGQLELLFEWFEGVFSHLQASAVRPTCMAEIKQAALFRTPT